ncbi:uncharacterized protein [Lepisosteus oculatus]|nr:PREDICTED: uncharacterized protein LOC107079114 isoform X2 [Lepisosteus oculatus]
MCDNEETVLAGPEITEQKFEDVLSNWVTEINGIQKHSGQAPLFTENMLSPIKDEQLSGQPLPKSLKPLKARTTSPEGQLFYRPERSHRYLQATVFESDAHGRTERPQSALPALHLGRPTRSSLLRTRYLSPSVSKDFHQKDKTTPSPKKCSSSRLPLNLKELQRACTSVGEDVHSFLIGARYNRERYMDSVAVEKYGVYLSRSYPNCAFLTQSETPKKHDKAHALRSHRAKMCQGNREEGRGITAEHTNSHQGAVKSAWGTVPAKAIKHTKRKEQQNDTMRTAKEQHNTGQVKGRSDDLKGHCRDGITPLSAQKWKDTMFSHKAADRSDGEIKSTSPPQSQNSNSSGLLVKAIKPSKSHLRSSVAESQGAVCKI